MSEDDNSQNSGASVELDSAADDNPGVVAEVSSSVSSAPITSWADSIPSDYKEKPYMKELLKNKDPNAEFFKQFDNLQTKLGQSVTVPGDDATDDEWQKFYARTAPKEAAEYDIPKVELAGDKKDLGEYLNSELDGELGDKLKQIFHKHKLPKKGAAAALKEIQELRAEVFGEQQISYLNEQKKIDDEYKTLATKAFGENFSEKVKDLHPLVKQSVPEELHKYLQDLPAPALVAIALQSKYYREKFMKEDSFGPTSTAVKGESLTDLRRELNESYADKAQTDPFSPDYKKHNEYRKELSKKIASLEARGHK